MKLVATPIIAFVLTFFGLVGLLVFFNVLTQPAYEPCVTEADAGRQFANTGIIRKNAAGQYLCAVESTLGG